ncbi:MAG TPA: PqiC family protein [Ideonella sp.]|uniref:PqiC family protein n=1 Tax=Ideonella sp. TaxID=1929293 RepID=UPI002E357078|nr:PqiC family protein [Ideonella sp.]HEX5684909.1 PqiC family protein [Ideonella sp.]
MKQGWWLSIVVAVGLAACAGSPSPPLRYYQLRLEPPAGEAGATRASAPQPDVWQLVSVRLPDYLDRDALWLAVGANALQPMDGHRWAEPLRATVPRVLAHDLGVLRGADRVWSGSVPAGVAVARQIRVEVLEFGPAPDGRAVRLRARWTITDPHGGGAAQIGETEVEAPSAGRAPESQVDAHRLALWRLAQRMAERASPA